MKNKSLYIATFIVALATLVFEISLTRILSVMTWYSMAFFCVSIAMLGMTAGSIFVFFDKKYFSGERVQNSLGLYSLFFSISIPICLSLLCLIPIIDKIPSHQFMPSFSVIVTSLVSMIPFFFSGVVISAVLTKAKLPIGKIYAYDLIGASFGCLMVLVLLNFASPMTTILISACFASICSQIYLHESKNSFLRKASGSVSAILISLAFAHHFSGGFIRPLFVKQKLERPSDYSFEKWNTHSRVTLKSVKNDFYSMYGISSTAKVDQTKRLGYIEIDGAAGTYAYPMKELKDRDDLKYHVTNIGHYLAKKGTACIMGVGGGKDMQSALVFGHKKVVGIELNPIMIDIILDDFSSIIGLKKFSNVHFEIDEARSYLTNSGQKCDWLQMSLIDTNAAVAAGAMTLSENALYTKEAFQIFTDSLTDEGIFSVTRIKKIGLHRLISLGLSSLYDRGVKSPKKHMMIISSSIVSTMLLSKMPFSEKNIALVKKMAEDLKFELTYFPGSSVEDPFLNKMLSFNNETELLSYLRSLPINWEPPTDDNPYFFNMMRFGEKPVGSNIVVDGNYRATGYLLDLILVLMFLGVVTLIIPVMLKSKKSIIELREIPQFFSGAIYFSLIGLGFMLFEVSLIQKFGLFLGHPVYSLSVILFSIILSTGVGSGISSKIFTLKSLDKMIYTPILMSILIVGYLYISPIIMSASITQPLGVRILITACMTFPAGLIMGLFFPIGMEIFKDSEESLTPWFFALNGIMGVLGTCLTMLISIYLGISASMYLAALSYLLLYYPLKQRLFLRNNEEIF